jgi:hypothetical protein
MTGTTVDGWGISASVCNSSIVTASVFDSYGHTYTPATIETDTNGNQVNSNGTSYIDASGQPILTISGGQYSYTGPGGATEAYVPTYSTLTTSGRTGCPGEATQSPGSGQMLTKLTLPDGSSYSFSYEPSPIVAGAVTGRIASITLPTGGTITYQYSGGTNGVNCRR